MNNSIPPPPHLSLSSSLLPFSPPPPPLSLSLSHSRKVYKALKQIKTTKSSEPVYSDILDRFRGRCLPEQQPSSSHNAPVLSQQVTDPEQATRETVAVRDTPVLAQTITQPEQPTEGVGVQPEPERRLPGMHRGADMDLALAAGRNHQAGYAETPMSVEEHGKVTDPATISSGELEQSGMLGKGFQRVQSSTTCAIQEESGASASLEESSSTVLDDPRQPGALAQPQSRPQETFMTHDKATIAWGKPRMIESKLDRSYLRGERGFGPSLPDRSHYDEHLSSRSMLGHAPGRSYHGGSSRSLAEGTSHSVDTESSAQRHYPNLSSDDVHNGTGAAGFGLQRHWHTPASQ